MGCVECKICHQSEEQNQFEYPQTIPRQEENNQNNQENQENQENQDLNNIGIITTTNNYMTNKDENPNFIQEFEEKLNTIGKYFPEEEFHTILSSNSEILYKPESPFPFGIGNPFSHKMKPIQFPEGSIYEGEWNENFEMDGYGKYYLKEEKVLAEGIWDKGELKKARIYYPNGEFYEGEMSNSCYNGKGKFVNENKDIYEGDFLDGEKTGEGKINFSDGCVYKGNFLKNCFNGYGELEAYPNISYKGNFVDNYLEGKGTFTDGEEKYEGEFKKNYFNGKGIYTYINGDEYEGDFEFGIRKGKGIYKQKNGITFEGFWDNDVPNGFGKFNLNGKIIKCNYHNGKIMDRPVDEDGLYYNNIDYNFFCQKMKLSWQKLKHLDNPDITNAQYRAESIMSFLEEEEGEKEE